jgi:hypothetical protein
MRRAEKQAAERLPPEQLIESPSELPPSNQKKAHVSKIVHLETRMKISRTETEELATEDPVKVLGEVD